MHGWRKVGNLAGEEFKLEVGGKFDCLIPRREVVNTTRRLVLLYCWKIQTKIGKFKYKSFTSHQSLSLQAFASGRTNAQNPMKSSCHSSARHTAGLLCTIA